MTDSIRLQEAHDEGYLAGRNGQVYSPKEQEVWYITCYQEGYDEGKQDRKVHYDDA